MDSPQFILALLSMIDAKYQPWRNGIPYVERPVDDMDNGEFSETYLMPFLSTKVSILSFSLSFSPSLHLVILNCDHYVKVWLALLQVVLLTLLIYLNWSMLMALMALLKSVSWDVTRMSWVIPFRQALFHPCLFLFSNLLKLV